MNEPENKVPEAPEVIELRKECADLRRQAGMLLIGVAMVSFTLTVFLGLQARRAAKDLTAIRTQLTQIVDTNKKEGPAIQNFVAQLVQYGQTHPEFQQMLSKYNIRAGTNAPAPASPQ